MNADKDDDFKSIGFYRRLSVLIGGKSFLLCKSILLPIVGSIPALGHKPFGPKKFDPRIFS